MNDDRSNASQDENPYQAKPAPKSSCSCCVWGCLVMFLLAGFVVVGGGVGAYWWIQGQVTKYTADTGADLPVVELPEAELAEVRDRVDNFKETIEAGETPDDLVLTAEELNALITKDENLRGKIFVTIEDGEVGGELSIPADAFPGGKGRFFNASAKFDVSLENGVLIVTLADAEVKGEKLPQQFMEAMSKENFAKDMYKDPEMAKTLGRIESISIDHDKIVLKPRAAASEEKGDDATGGDEKASNVDSAAPEVQPPPAEPKTPAGAKATPPQEPDPATEAQ